MFYLYTEVKGAFIIYGPGGVWTRGGGENFATYSREGGRGATFLAYFLGGAILFQSIIFEIFFFRKNYITCILILVGALQQHKGMFLKHGRAGGNNFPAVSWRGGDFFPVYSRGGGGPFFWPIDFAKPPPLLRP